MADYFSILNQKSDFLNTFQQRLREAAENAPRKISAATIVQRLYRGRLGGKAVQLQLKAILLINKEFRRILGRARVARRRKEVEEDRFRSVLRYSALQLQRVFRGYYSRKYKHNFLKRKEYVQQIMRKGNEIRLTMEKYATEQRERERQEGDKRRRQEYQEYAKNLHHLLSTAHISGVYNPPQEFMTTPTVDDMPVESYIRGVIRDLLRTKGISKTGLVRDVHGSLRVPLKGLKNRLSVQASAPYDSVRVEEAREKAVSRLLTQKIDNNAGPGFLAGGRTDIIDNPPLPLSTTGEPYLDHYQNVFTVRGVPESIKQLEESIKQRKALFAKFPEKPYYVRGDGNKSTVMANDLFDVIAEAEQTGGAAQRHLGTTTRRFGLPDSADNRLPEGNGTIPAPPLRATAFLRTRGKISSNPVSSINVRTMPRALAASLDAESSDDATGTSHGMGGYKWSTSDVGKRKTGGGGSASQSPGKSSVGEYRGYGNDEEIQPYLEDSSDEDEI